MKRYDAGVALVVIGVLGLLGGVEYSGWVLFVECVVVL